MAQTAKLVQERFSAPVTPFINREISQAGLTVLTVFRNDPDRLGFSIINLSTVAMFANIRRTVSSSFGIRIGPNGGNISAVWFEDFETVAWEWFIIADAAASNLLAIEYLSGS